MIFSPKERAQKIRILWRFQELRWIAATILLVLWVLLGAFFPMAPELFRFVLVGVPLYLFATSASVFWVLRPQREPFVSETMLERLRIVEAFTDLLVVGSVVVLTMNAFSSVSIAPSPVGVSPAEILMFAGILIVLLLALALVARDPFGQQNAISRDLELSRTLLESIPEALLLLDANGRVLFLNRSAEQMFCVQRADLLKGSGNDAAQAPSRFPALAEALAVKVPAAGEGELLLDLDGRKERYIVSEVSIAHGAFAPASLRVFRRASHDEKVSRAKTHFLSVAAHQLRTPISGLKWALDMVLSGELGPLNETQRQFLLRASETSERMIRLISDLLDVTRIEEGRFGYTFRSEPAFGDYLCRIVDGFRERAAAKKIALECRLPSQQLPPLVIDGSRLAIALENVIANALNYTFQGSVTVRAERRGDEIAVIVEDTGIGIPAEAQKNLFEKFFRAENVIRLGLDGTGLGLFITRSILERHGGTVRITSEEGRGTTVTMTLPIDPKRIPSGELPMEDFPV